MGLFDQYKEPVMLKTDSEAETQLAALKELRKEAQGELAERLDQEIKLVESGIYGEKAVEYELKNSHIPMFVLHDLFLEYGDLTAQIDYLVVTRKRNYVIECKNLFGNIEINSNGDFIRTVSYGKGFKKEGIYSPITQNHRHLELIKQLRGAEKGNILTKAMFEHYFDENYRSLVVLANPQTTVNMRFAKKEIKEQVIRADQLSAFLREDGKKVADSISEKQMESLARFFLDNHRAPKTDYTEKYRAKLQTSMISEQESVPESKQETEKQILCPKCGAPMVLRTSTKGQYAGKQFYGCSNYPRCRSIIQLK